MTFVLIEELFFVILTWVFDLYIAIGLFSEVPVIKWIPHTVLQGKSYAHQVY